MITFQQNGLQLLSDHVSWSGTTPTLFAIPFLQPTIKPVGMVRRAGRYGLFVKLHSLATVMIRLLICTVGISLVKFQPSNWNVQITRRFVVCEFAFGSYISVNCSVYTYVCTCMWLLDKKLQISFSSEISLCLKRILKRIFPDFQRERERCFIP